MLDSRMGSSETVERILNCNNYFELFEYSVDDELDANVLQSRYRKLALKCHPDKVEHDSAEMAFKTLTEALTVLLDPIARIDYKRTLTGTIPVKSSGQDKQHQEPKRRSAARSYQAEDPDFPPPEWWATARWHEIEKEFRRQEELFKKREATKRKATEDEMERKRQRKEEATRQRREQQEAMLKKTLDERPEEFRGRVSSWQKFMKKTAPRR
eukprot:Colp12_sorted_trinity150504_noHs@31460